MKLYRMLYRFRLPRHFYLINTRWLQIYLFGSFCAIEIDVPGRCFQFFTDWGFFNTFSTRLTPKPERSMRRMIRWFVILALIYMAPWMAILIPSLVAR